MHLRTNKSVGDFFELWCRQLKNFQIKGRIKAHGIYRSETNGFDFRKAKWFKNGMDFAMRAPTAINQQKFLITLKDGKVTFKSFFGPCHKIDLGIVKYHFELGAKIQKS
ncbi:MAG: hypothetical protein IJW54_05695 [Clostridia bacterium]|nr:hypothetical protein [Clostridia bacterium]